MDGNPMDRAALSAAQRVTAVIICNFFSFHRGNSGSPLLPLPTTLSGNCLATDNSLLSPLPTLLMPLHLVFNLFSKDCFFYLTFFSVLLRWAAHPIHPHIQPHRTNSQPAKASQPARSLKRIAVIQPTVNHTIKQSG